LLAGSKGREHSTSLLGRNIFWKAIWQNVTTILKIYSFIMKKSPEVRLQIPLERKDFHEFSLVATTYV
jgi:hypothetical protein